MRRWEAIGLLCSVLFIAARPSFPQSALTRQEQLEAHARRAQEYMNEHKLDLAASEFRAILTLNPKNVDARANLGVLLFFQGKYPEAIPQFRAALTLRPALSKIQALLGVAEKRTGDFHEARTDLDEAFPKLRGEKIRIETGMELIDLDSQVGDLDEAAATIAVLRKTEPTNQSILYSAYRVYSELTDQSILSLMVAAPDSAYMHELMGLELAKHGHPKESIENFRAAIKIDPKLPGPHFELAEVLNASTATREEAESEYKKALALNPFDEASERRLGDIAAERGNLKESYERYTRAVELRPDDAQASLGLAKALMSMGQMNKAEPLLKRSIQLDPTSAVAHFRLSTLYRRTGRRADAARELQQYQKYKAIKEKLQDIYHMLHVQPANEEPGDAQAATE
ncbi:MAG: tetratricopeptide repeat protein [Terriglobia bacterium]